MTAAIAAIATATPEHRRTQSQMADQALALCTYTPEQERLLRRFYDNATIRHRATALFGDRLYARDANPGTATRLAHYPQAAPHLAARAAAGVIERASIASSDITHLITASCTGFSAPGIDIKLIDDIDLAPTVDRTAIGFMGCHGALNALRVAAAFVDADPRRIALLCAVELCSLHFFYGWDPEKVLANALFADGAAAAIVRANQGRPILASGSCVVPHSAHAMSWTIGDHGFEMTLARDVPDLIRAHAGPWLRAWLDAHDLAISDIRSWAIHPGGPRILDAVADALDLDDELTHPSRDILAEHGNMSSPTVLFILDRLRKLDAPGPTVAIGFGPGLAIEATLLA